MALADPVGIAPFVCATCGVRNEEAVLFYCDRVEGGPWCGEHFDAATGCDTHDEGCLTAVFQDD